MQINGVELMGSPASFGDVMGLKKALADALKGTSVSLDNLSPGADVGGVLDAILSVSTDEKVRECLFACSKRFVYGKDKLKINEEFFQDVKHWELYYPIMVEVVKVNLSPFFKGLNFGSLIPENLIESLHEQK